jgi:transcriptional regulator with XRE-family HTH domain
MKKSTFTREYKVFCGLLRECREKGGVTQAELAKRLDETQSEISKFERGERRMDLVQLREWCRATGTKLSDFARAFEEALPARRK